MNEIRCPNCGKVFQVDEAGYAAIVSQVHNEQFEKELADRSAALRREMEASGKNALTELAMKHERELAAKDQEILRLREQYAGNKDKINAQHRERYAALHPKEDE